MPTYIPPVSLSTFKLYLKESSVDVNFNLFLQQCLERATDFIYTYLGYDFTPSVYKEDRFWGNDSFMHMLIHPYIQVYDGNPAPPSDDTAIVSVIEYGRGYEVLSTALTPFPGVAPLLYYFGPNGTIIRNTLPFFRGRFYHVRVQQATSVICPDAVQEAIIEMAARIFEESRYGLGRLGKETDYSNVLATSQVKYISPALWTSELRQRISPYYNFRRA